MRARLAELLQLPLDRISVKATTTEGMGYTGREEGLLAQAVATRQAMGDDAVRHLSGLALFGEADAADLPDDLHPNTQGYRRMGERFHALMLSGSNALLTA